MSLITVMAAASSVNEQAIKTFTLMVGAKIMRRVLYCTFESKLMTQTYITKCFVSRVDKQTLFRS